MDLGSGFGAGPSEGELRLCGSCATKSAWLTTETSWEEKNFLVTLEFARKRAGFPAQGTMTSLTPKT